MKAKLKCDIYTHNAQCDRKAGDVVEVENAGSEFMRFYGREVTLYRDTKTGCTYTENILESIQD